MMKDIFKIIISVVCVLLAFTVYTQNNKFSKEQVVGDLLFMDSIIRAVHPDPFYETPLFCYTYLKDSVISNFLDSLNLETAYLSIAPLLAALRDGHSMMMAPYDPLVTLLFKLPNTGLDFCLSTKNS